MTSSPISSDAGGGALKSPSLSRPTPRPGKGECAGCEIKSQDFRFLSFPRQRESSKPLKRLDARVPRVRKDEGGYDEFTSFAKVLKV